MIHATHDRFDERNLPLQLALAARVGIRMFEDLVIEYASPRPGDAEPAPHRDEPWLDLALGVVACATDVHRLLEALFREDRDA